MTDLARELEAMRPRLISVATSYGSSEPHDIAQRAIIKAWTGWPKYRGESLLSSWMHSIVHNLCRDEHRWKKATVELDPAIASSHNLLTEIINKDLCERILSCNSPDIPAIVMVAEGHRMRAIGAAHGVSECAIKCRIHRTRERIKQAVAV